MLYSSFRCRQFAAKKKLLFFFRFSLCPCDKRVHFYFNITHCFSLASFLLFSGPDVGPYKCILLINERVSVCDKAPSNRLLLDV